MALREIMHVATDKMSMMAASSSDTSAMDEVAAEEAIACHGAADASETVDGSKSTDSEQDENTPDQALNEDVQSDSVNGSEPAAKKLRTEL
jgi:hypothetical protein